jgi:hypothetical protein
MMIVLRDDDDDDDDDEDSLDRELRRDTADAARVASYQSWCLRLQDAWRKPVAHYVPESGPKRATDAAEPDNSSPPDVMRAHLRGSDPEDAQARRDAAAAEYAASLSNTWKTPSGAMPPARMPRPGSRDPQSLGEQWRGGR